MRQLDLLDWREVFEELNRVEHVLRFDPSGVYPRMDFDTRDRCRRAIEELAYGPASPRNRSPNVRSAWQRNPCRTR